jgi:putative ABC transport system ATP-binding protein
MTTGTAGSEVGVIAARIESGTKTYGSGDTEVRALDNVSEAFEKGRYSAIMGPSGSGKSTLLHCIAGLDELTSGQVYIGDTDLGSLNDKNLTLLRRQKVGFVFQSFNLVPTLSAKENILLPLLIAGEKEDDAWFEQVVGILGLGDRLKHRPSELSGGQQQRVAAAARHHLCRRTERESRLQVRGGVARLHASGGARVWADDRDGHP